MNYKSSQYYPAFHIVTAGGDMILSVVEYGLQLGLLKDIQDLALCTELLEAVHILIVMWPKADPQIQQTSV